MDPLEIRKWLVFSYIGLYDLCTVRRCAKECGGRREKSRIAIEMGQILGRMNQRREETTRYFSGKEFRLDIFIQTIE